MRPARALLTQPLRGNEPEIHASQKHQEQANRERNTHDQRLYHAIFFATFTKQQGQRTEETEDDAGQNDKDEDFDQHGVHKKSVDALCNLNRA